MRRSAVPILLWALAISFVAGIVHLSTVLMVPRLAPDAAFDRVAAITRPGSVVVLPDAAAGPDAIPFRDPALMSALCRYDLSAGPLRVVAATADGGFTAVSFHSRYGRPFYALTESSAVEGKIEVLLVTADQRARIEAADPEDQPIREVRVTSPGDEGFVEFDVLPRVGGGAAARRALGSVSCQVERSL